MIIANPPLPGHPSAMLHVISPQNNPKGTLLTPMSNAQRQAIANPANGLLVYNTDFQTFDYFKNGVWTVIADTNKVKTMLDLKVMSLTSLINLAEQNAKAYTDSKVFYLNGRIDSLKIKQTNLTNALSATNTNFNNFLIDTLPTIRNNITSINTSISTLDVKVNTLQNNTIPNLQSQMNGFWRLGGNSGTNGAFIGTNEPLVFKVNNEQVAKFYENSTLFIGLESGLNSSTMGSNIGIGKLSLKNVISAVSSIGIGNAALLNCQGCNSDLAIGSDAMSFSNSLWFNVAIGRGALQGSHVGKNTAIGNLAGINTNGFGNVFIGSQTKSTIPNINNSFVIGSEGEVGCSDCGVLGTANTKIGIGTSTPTEKLEVVGGKTKLEILQVTSGTPSTGKVWTATDNQGNGTWAAANAGWSLNGNVDATNDSYLGTPAGGAQSLNFKVDGRIAGRIESHGLVSTSYGVGSLQQETTGFWNSAFGEYTLSGNTSGNSNSAFGSRSLAGNNGSGNSSFGFWSLINNISGSTNSAFGSNAGSYSLGSDNSFFGAETNTSTLTPNISNATAVGKGAIVDASNKIRFGDDNIISISYAVNASISSDRRLKKGIRNSTLGLSFIKKLQTVDYEYIAEGQKGIRYTGFIAQDVEKAAIESGTRDWSGLDKSSLPSGGHYALRYAEFVVPLTKAIQEQQTIIETQEKKIADLKKENEDLKKRMETIEKMFLEMKK